MTQDEEKILQAKKEKDKITLSIETGDQFVVFSKEVMKLDGSGKATIWEMKKKYKDGELFPKPIKIGFGNKPETIAKLIGAHQLKHHMVLKFIGVDTIFPSKKESYSESGKVYTNFKVFLAKELWMARPEKDVMTEKGASLEIVEDDDLPF